VAPLPRNRAKAVTYCETLKNAQFVIASEVKQSHKPMITKEIATHMRLAMTGSEFFRVSL